jgi:hypothetical protein
MHLYTLGSRITRIGILEQRPVGNEIECGVIIHPLEIIIESWQQWVLQVHRSSQTFMDLSHGAPCRPDKEQEAGSEQCDGLDREALGADDETNAPEVG